MQLKGLFFFVPTVLLAAVLSTSCFVYAKTAKTAPGYFDSLQRRLVKDGFSKQNITALYVHPKVTFETKAVSSYFVHSEGKLNYDQFLEPEPIRKAKAYMAVHEKALAKAEKTYGVHREVITAILLVETRLGTYAGSRLVFNILSTMASLSDKSVRDMLWKQVKSNTRLSRKVFNRKAAEKSGWAYRELKAFLKYINMEKLNPMTIKGSYAGAMGFCQFLPSNILTLARDGNGDGRIDLFNHADAVMSIANYLHHNGWHGKMDRKKAYKVVYTYNHSKYYVNTVLKITKKLR